MAGSASDVRAGGAYVEVWGDLRPLQRGLARGRRMMQSWGRSLITGGGIMAGIGAAMAAPLKKALDLFGVQESAEAKLAAVLESTGHAAGVTADELKELARSLQQATTFGDEEIINAEALLLTFKRIGSEVFPQTTEAALNMATMMGTDLKSAAIQVGKALNDPYYGLSMLNRIGVVFSDQQRETIQTLWDMGRTADAQRLILEELHSEFGGQARAQLETYPGLIQSIKNVWGDLGEVIGEAIRPSRHFLDSIKSQIANLKEWVAAHPGVVKAFAAVAGAFLVLGTAAMALGVTLLVLTSPFTLIIGLVLGVALAAAHLTEELGGVDVGLRDMLEGFRVGTQSVIGWWDIMTAVLYESWIEFKIRFVSALADMSKFFWGAISQWAKWIAKLADKIGMDEVAGKLQGFADSMSDYEPFEGALGKWREDLRRSREVEADIIAADQEQLAKREAKKFRARVNLPGIKMPGMETPKLPRGDDMQSGITASLGSANLAERMGKIGLKTVDREQLDVMKSMDSTLKKVAKNTEGEATATFG